MWKIPEYIVRAHDNEIKWEFSSEAEFIQIAQLKQLIGDCYLAIDYLPYGRQDKDIHNFKTFALHTFATLLNTLHFSKVVINDPHSDVALELIDHSISIYPIWRMSQAYSDTHSDIVCYPDEGARDKYSDMIKCLKQCFLTINATQQT